MLDVNWGDLVDYFGNDPRTHTIIAIARSNAVKTEKVPARQLPDLGVEQSAKAA
jgi:hypothetical protein